MKLGNIDTDVKGIPESKLSRSGTLGAKASGGGPKGGGNHGGSGGNGGSHSSSSERDSINRDKSRVIAWFLLLVVVMTFGGLIGAYIVIATNSAIEWAPFSLPVQVWISTFVILASSITYEFFRNAVELSNLKESRRYLVATTALGGVFIASQLIVWIELVNRGVYMRGNPYAGFFYILTAAHAIHVLGGMVALGSILRRSWYSARSADEHTYRVNLAKAVGWYWHLMGGLWVLLLILLAYWK